MQIVRKMFGAVLLLLLLFAAVELSYRYYILGPLAFNPLKVNSMNTIMRSEYVQKSEYPDIFFELKPGIRGLYKGVEFWTNSHGYPDKEYSLAKPDDTFRIAVAGSSWEMPSGVPPDTAWHKVLEDKLNAGGGNPNVEVINFGVEMYGLREIVATVRHRIVDWDADLILVGVTTYTTSLVWDSSDKPQVLPPRAYPALVPYSLRAIEYYVGDPEPQLDRQTLDDGEIPERMAQLYRAMRELGEISTQTGVPVVIVFEDFTPLPQDVEADIGRQAQQAGVRAVFANHIFPADFEERERYQVSLFDPHPSEAGHVLIADYVASQLEQQGVWPKR